MEDMPKTVIVPITIARPYDCLLKSSTGASRHLEVLLSAYAHLKVDEAQLLEDIRHMERERAQLVARATQQTDDCAHSEQDHRIIVDIADAYKKLLGVQKKIRKADWHIKGKLELEVEGHNNMANGQT